MSDGRADASERPTNDVRWAALLTLLGAALLVLGMTHRSAAGDDPVGVLDLHNDSAESGTCDTDTGPSWHFVIAPNDDEYAFESISLMIAGSLRTFSGDQIILNSGQRDNVYVPIPGGFTASDLVAAGSFAEVTPPPPTDGNVKFVLSSVCNGNATPTTTIATTTTSSTPTTAPTTTIPTTTVPGTTTSTPGTTTTSSTTTSSTTTSTSSPTSTSTTTLGPPPPPPDTTVVPPESTIVDSGGPPPAPTSTFPPSTTTSTSTTTTTSSTTTTTSTSTTTTTTTTVPASATTTTVPITTALTGSGDARVLIMIGSVLIIVGITLLISAHTRRRPSAL